jgi:hypothetical protein
MSDLTRTLWVRISNALYREDGQALTEYALVIALMVTIAAVVAGATATGLGTAMIDKIATELGRI